MNRFWARRNGRERFLILICAVAAVVGIPMLLSPPAAGNAKLLPAAEARQKYVREVRQKESMESDIARMKPLIEKQVYNETPEVVVPRIVRTLQDQAKKAGIHLREIKPLRARRMATVTKVPLSVRFASRFDQSIPFLYSIEDPGTRLVVEKFSISAPDSKSKTVDIEIQVALFTCNTTVGSES